ncbi:AEC family transporter [Hydrogenoanaerobacterium sp.]|uniref:AEC family transporter n=1 Tax=Hydrogenoanaerobacterium sp. TaxID=2953763 RepID=UPI00289BD353|nr:AEC family transporter [Hydrogenoanaerobacterium sp.]
MQTTLYLAQAAVPVFAAIGLGLVCRKAKLLSFEGLAGIKSIIFNIMLPLVLFNVLYKIEYNASMLFIVAIGFVSMALAMGAGILLRKLLRFEHKAMPFLLTCAEAGLVGYPLFILLAGEEQMHHLVTLDVGHGIFFFTVYTMLIQRAAGKKSTPKEMALGLLENKVIIGLVLGILVGVTGLGSAISGSMAGEVLAGTLEFITAPTGMLIMLTVGYEISMDKKLIKPVLTTVALRMVIMGTLLAVFSALVFSLIPFDKNLFLAMCMFFALPASFTISIFADELQEGEYISTTLSVQVLITLAAFVALTVYSMA